MKETSKELGKVFAMNFVAVAGLLIGFYAVERLIASVSKDKDESKKEETKAS